MAVPAIVAKARPIDWVSVAIAFTMPILFAMQSFMQEHPNPSLPPLDSALIIAALASLLAQLDSIRRKRAE